MWPAIEEFGNRLVKRGQVTFLQLADLASAHLAARTVNPYAHVVLDEAQDLHPAQWGILRAAVEPGVDDLFLVGDTHQRVYGSRVSLNKQSVEIRKELLSRFRNGAYVPNNRDLAALNSSSVRNPLRWS